MIQNPLTHNKFYDTKFVFTTLMQYTSPKLGPWPNNGSVLTVRKTRSTRVALCVNSVLIINGLT